MAKPTYATELYNRIDNYRKKEETKPTSGLLSRSSKEGSNANRNDLNFIADVVHNIRMKNPKKREMV